MNMSQHVTGIVVYHTYEDGLKIEQDSMLFKLSQDKSQLKEITEHLQEQTKDVVVEVRSPNRSKDQNALYWKNLQVLGDAQGYTKDEMNSLLKKSITESGKLKMMYLKWTTKMQVEVYKSTKDLTKKEFMILMDYIYQIGGLLQVKMIQPDDLFN